MLQDWRHQEQQVWHEVDWQGLEKRVQARQRLQERKIGYTEVSYVRECICNLPADAECKALCCSVNEKHRGHR